MMALGITCDGRYYSLRQLGHSLPSELCAERCAIIHCALLALVTFLVSHYVGFFSILLRSSLSGETETVLQF